MKIYKTLSSLHTLKIMLPLLLTLAIGSNFFTKKMNLQCGFWCARCSILKNDPRFIRIEGETEKWPSTTRMFLARECFNVCFILYTMCRVWLLFDNFDNIRTNKTDQSQLTVGIWSVFEPVGTPRNTCRHNFFIAFN